MRIYIASPFFSEEELNNVKTLEMELIQSGHQYFSPRLGSASITYGKLPKDHPERGKLAEEIFEENVHEISNSNFVLMNIDNRDTGTSWEAGFAYAVSIPIITTTFNDYNPNIMIGMCSVAHTVIHSTRRRIYEIMRSIDPSNITENDLKRISEVSDLKPLDME